MLPGVPREMRGMLDDEILPILKERATGDVILSKTLRTTGIGESAIAEILGPDPLGGGRDNPVGLAYLPSAVGVDLRLTARRAPQAKAAAAIDAAAMKLRKLIGAYVYGEDDADLAAVVLAECRRQKLSIGVAESCTGGMLGERLTAVAGSSSVFLGGVIAYQNGIKQQLLGVAAGTLEQYGAVSLETAREMARGARRQTGADIGIGITGIAGPDGGTPAKPVGMVCVALDRDGAKHEKELRLIGDRQEIRQRSVQAALDMLRRSLQGL
jgi:nicotinamide-nucleotide amidase